MLCGKVLFACRKFKHIVGCYKQNKQQESQKSNLLINSYKILICSEFWTKSTAGCQLHEIIGTESSLDIWRYKKLVNIIMTIWYRIHTLLKNTKLCKQCNLVSLIRAIKYINFTLHSTQLTLKSERSNSYQALPHI